MSAKKSKLKRKLAKMAMQGTESTDKVYQILKKASHEFINNLNKKLHDSTAVQRTK